MDVMGNWKLTAEARSAPETAQPKAPSPCAALTPVGEIATSSTEWTQFIKFAPGGEILR